MLHFCCFFSRQTVPAPVIDGINEMTFEYEKGASNLMGGFDADFVFDWFPRNVVLGVDNSVPFK